MLILIYTSNGWWLWSVNHTPVIDNSKIKVFRKIKSVGKTSNDCLNVWIYAKLLDHVNMFY